MVVGDAYVFPGFLTPALTQLFFPKPLPKLLFSHASANVRGQNTPERKVASTGDRTHNHQVMSLTRSPLSHPGGAGFSKTRTYFKTKQPVLMWLYTFWYCRLTSVIGFCIRFYSSDLVDVHSVRSQVRD